MPRIKNPITIVGTTGAAAPVLQELTITASGVYTPSTGYDGISKVTASFDESTELTNLRKIINGTATTIVVPSTMTSVAAYLCRKGSPSSTLTSVDLGNVTTIGQYAFYYNTHISWVLQQVDGVNYFPRAITSIGTYALYYAGSNKRSTDVFVLYPSSSATIDSYAFRNGNCAKVKGTYTFIGMYAFCSCNVDEIDLTCSGAVDNYAFQQCPVTSVNLVAQALGNYALNITNSGLVTMSLKVANGIIGNCAVDGCQYVSAFTWDPSSKVTSLGNYAFRGLGARRSGANTFTVDLSNSTFTSVGQSAFYPTSTSFPLKNMHIILPRTVSSVGQSAFGYLKDSEVEFASIAPPTVNSVNVFSGWDNTYLTCPVGSINEYRTKTNYTQIAEYIRGKITGVTKLPKYNAEGYELTWYHDIACTNAVSAQDIIDDTMSYYCLAGQEVIAYQYVGAHTFHCDLVAIVNGDMLNDGDMIRVGDQVVLSITPETGYEQKYLLQANGVDCTTTITMPSEPLEIRTCYYDGVNAPYSNVLNDNDWDAIAFCAKAHLAPELWSVGDTKTISFGEHSPVEIGLTSQTLSFNGNLSDDEIAQKVRSLPTASGLIEVYIPTYGLLTNIIWCGNFDNVGEEWIGVGTTAAQASTQGVIWSAKNIVVDGNTYTKGWQNSFNRNGYKWSALSKTLQFPVEAEIRSFNTDFSTVFSRQASLPDQVVRLADMTPNRYSLADTQGSTNAVFEWQNCCPNPERYGLFGISDSSIYAFALGANSGDSSFDSWGIYTALQSDIYNLLPTALKNVIKDYYVKTNTSSSGYGTNNVMDVRCKLFVASPREMTTDTVYTPAGEGTVWQYYADNDRTKRSKSGTGYGYMLRSRPTNMSPAAYYIQDGGAISAQNSDAFTIGTVTFGLAPCFAL